MYRYLFVAQNCWYLNVWRMWKGAVGELSHVHVADVSGSAIKCRLHPAITLHQTLAAAFTVTVPTVYT